MTNSPSRAILRANIRERFFAKLRQIDPHPEDFSPILRKQSFDQTAREGYIHQEYENTNDPLTYDRCVKLDAMYDDYIVKPLKRHTNYFA